MVRFLIVAMLLATSLSASEGFYLESPPLGTRAEALELQEVGQLQGISARVVRRYEHGSGWEYLVVVEGYGSRGEAEHAAQLFAEGSGHGITVYEGEGGSGRRLTARGEGWTGSSIDPGAVATAPAKDELPAADEVLARSVRALGGESGGALRLQESPAFRFRYERELDTPAGVVRAKHDLAWEQGDLRLKIEHQSGPGQYASMLVHGDKAWVHTEDGMLERDPQRCREVLADFGPLVVLDWPLNYAQQVYEDPAFQDLRVAGIEEFDGRSVYRLETNRDGTGERFSILVDSERYTVAKVGFRSNAGAVSYRFDDWRELDTGLVVPFFVVLTRDGVQVEKVVVQELELLDALPGQIWSPLDGKDDPFFADDPSLP
jgi:hypothetical protein